MYETVNHPEEGHYETVTHEVQKVRCNCGILFDSAAEQKAHQDAFIAEMRKTDPDYVCTGTHMGYFVTETESEEVYVVDKEAWSEQVLVSEGHWE